MTRRAARLTGATLLLLLLAAAGPGLVAASAPADRTFPAEIRLAAQQPPPAVVRYDWPLAGPPPVVRRFEPPVQRWLPGHRGVDLAAPAGARVSAAADGVVHFAGPVAGRPVVSVNHADGLRTTYEPVVPMVAAGARVRAGEPIGELVAGHPGCPVPSCLHWGVRHGRDYLDPLSLLGLGQVRLLPTDAAVIHLSQVVHSGVAAGWGRCRRRCHRIDHDERKAGCRCVRGAARRPAPGSSRAGGAGPQLAQCRG